MRILMSLLLLVLFCSLQLTSTPHALESSSSCCVQFYKNKIPLNLVVCFVVFFGPRFRTAAGREFCLDPDNGCHWVQKKKSTPYLKGPYWYPKGTQQPMRIAAPWTQTSNCKSKY
uniref:Chemokine (C-C motif) ligand 39, duplicate 1 n=1 Tax=Cyprinus carpio TaxID=7962 RepID=A0A8C1UZI9_CYPCA